MELVKMLNRKTIDVDTAFSQCL